MGLDRQPDGVDANHRSSSRIQAAHCEAAAQGQFTVIAVVPRRSSMRMAAGSVLGRRQLHRHEGARHGITGSPGQRPATTPLGIEDPTTCQVRVDAMGHRHRSARYARRVACRHDLRLELGAMRAPASTASADFVGDSVHVSTKNLVDTSILKRSAAIKVPRRDAYRERYRLPLKNSAEPRDEGLGERRIEVAFGPRALRQCRALGPTASYPRCAVRPRPRMLRPSMGASRQCMMNPSNCRNVLTCPQASGVSMSWRIASDILGAAGSQL